MGQSHEIKHISGMVEIASFDKPIKTLKCGHTLLIQFEDGSWASMIPFYLPKTESDMVH